MHVPLLAVMLLVFERCGAPQPCPTAKEEEEEIRMSSRPLPVTVAAILLVLLSLFNFPWVYEIFFPGAEGPPAALLYSGYVVGVVGLVAAVGLWMLQKWSYWSTIVVCVLNFLLGAPGVVFAAGAALKAFIAVTEVVAILIIVLVVLPDSRRALADAGRPSRVR
jgi:hypothetical protein